MVKQVNKMFEKTYELYTYKSLWYQCRTTGCYKRIQRKNYPLQWIDNRLFRVVPRLRGYIPMLSRKRQGVDYYRYYSDILKSESRGKWVDEFAKVKHSLVQINFFLDQKSVLDISGEPGFFASDATEMCKSVDVTAFSSEVALAMRDYLHIPAETYDFNTHKLGVIYEGRTFDLISVRYSIGFCEDLPRFVEDIEQLLTYEGVIYISFSPASRGICARWMFDDYTYLRLYTRDYLVNVFKSFGLALIAEFSEGAYRWDCGLHWSARLIAKYYTGSLFSKMDEKELLQDNVSLVFKRRT